MGYSDLCKRIMERYKNIKRKSLTRIIKEDEQLASEIKQAYINDEITEEEYDELMRSAGYERY